MTYLFRQVDIQVANGLYISLSVLLRFFEECQSAVHWLVRVHGAHGDGQTVLTESEEIQVHWLTVYWSKVAKTTDMNRATFVYLS